MSAAVMAPCPLLKEATEFWEKLRDECKRQMDAINAAASKHGMSGDELLQWTSDSAQIAMNRSACPSTKVEVKLEFYNWGPTITGTVRGRQDCAMNFAPEGFELPIAIDLDGEVVAMVDEGRSLCPREVALYFTQNFRRCYPGIALHC